MPEQAPGNWRRKFNRYIGIVTAAVGVAIVLSSFLFLRDFFWWYITVAAGLITALLGFVYGLNPFMTSERQYTALRGEVDSFIGLVRELNKAATNGSAEEFDSVKSRMMASVDRMAELAGQDG